jgi:NAD(P)-dependent dehydrogenase (short-subunit alcohol dehydrogenase family)
VSERPESVFISGVSRGIGRALLEAFLDDGWRVWGTARCMPVAPDLELLAKRFEPRLSLLQLDSSDWAGCMRVCAEIREPLDVLVNSAATFGDRAFSMDTLEPAAMLDAFAINVVGPTALARALKPNLLLGRRKLIVMMSTGNASLAGNKEGKMVAYRASKSALNQIVRSMAAEWAGEGIVTVALNPGWVRTRMGGEQAPLSASAAAQNIVSFVRQATAQHSGRFLNTDGSELPW